MHDYGRQNRGWRLEIGENEPRFKSACMIDRRELMAAGEEHVREQTRCHHSWRGRNRGDPVVLVSRV